jgi:hypothetical protein
MIIEARTAFGNTLFREIFITACWIIWTTRNSIIFDNGYANLNNWKREFRAELDLVCTKALVLGEIAIASFFFPCCFGPCCLVPFCSCLLFHFLLYKTFFHLIEKQKILGRGFPY